MKSKSRWIQVLIVLIAVLLIVLNRAVVFDVPAPEGVPSAHNKQQADDSPLHWGNLRTLQDHFERHGADFDARDGEDYARQAHAFYVNRAQYQVKTDTDGTVRIYDAATNAFGAYNANGTTRTYFKPGNGQAYFDRQPGE